MQQGTLNAQILRLRREAASLRLQAKEEFSPGTFAKTAKLERQANAIDKQLAGLQRAQPCHPNLLQGLRTIKVCFTMLKLPPCAEAFCSAAKRGTGNHGTMSCAR
jgi:hypothetical protein